MRMLLMVILLAGTCFAPGLAQERTSRTVWSGTVGQRQVVVDERWTPPFTDVLLSVRVTAPGKTSAIEVSTSGRPPDLVVPWASDRLVLMTAELVSVVDLASELVVDQFLAGRPSISPTGRFIAYSRFQPPQSKEEEVLLVHSDGDPDRPIIMSSVPNAETVSPVTQANATQASIRTRHGVTVTFDDCA